ncbi:unnamed protein product, partial [Brassica oleracea]
QFSSLFFLYSFCSSICSFHLSFSFAHLSHLCFYPLLIFSLLFFFSKKVKRTSAVSGLSVSFVSVDLLTTPPPPSPSIPSARHHHHHLITRRHHHWWTRHMSLMEKVDNANATGVSE